MSYYLQEICYFFNNLLKYKLILVVMIFLYIGTTYIVFASTVDIKTKVEEGKSHAILNKYIH